MPIEIIISMIIVIFFFAGYVTGTLIQEIKTNLKERERFLQQRKEIERRNTK